MSILQELQQDAYLHLLLCFAAYPLDWESEQMLGDVRKVLDITNDDHRRHLSTAMADPRVQAMKRGDDDVPMSFAGRPIQRNTRASSPPLPSTYDGGRNLARAGSQRGRPPNVRISDQGADVKSRGPGRPPGRQPLSPASQRKGIKRNYEDELPMESPFLQHHQSASLGAAGRGRGMRRVSNLEAMAASAMPAGLQLLSSAGTASGLPAPQHLPVIRPLLEAYLHSNDAALLEGTLQRLNARQHELQAELRVAQQLQGDFADELELRSLQMQDLEAAERKRRNELADQRTLILMNET